LQNYPNFDFSTKFFVIRRVLVRVRERAQPLFPAAGWALTQFLWRIMGNKVPKLFGQVPTADDPLAVSSFESRSEFIVSLRACFPARSCLC
jgi:hypothetical protein